MNIKNEEVKDWSNDRNDYIPAPNLSSGFHGLLFEYMKYYGIGKTCILTAEPLEVIPIFEERFPGVEFSVLSYFGEKGEKFKQDLNILFNYVKTFDTVFSQATLEHVCRPSIMIENLVNMCNISGHIIIHSVNPGFALHRFPIDCVRFFKDFYFDLQKYLPIKIVAFAEQGTHQFVAYERIDK